MIEQDKKQNAHIKAGKLFCFSSGEYSDYIYEGHFLALQDITPAVFDSVIEDCKADLVASNEDNEDWELKYKIRGKFIPTLIKKGVVMDIDCQEIHLGSYGGLDVDWW